MIVLDKDTNRRRTLPNQPQEKTIYVDVKPKVSDERINFRFKK